MTEGSGLGVQQEPPVATKFTSISQLASGRCGASGPASNSLGSNIGRSRLVSDCRSQISTDTDSGSNESSRSNSPVTSNDTSLENSKQMQIAPAVNLVSGQNASILRYTTDTTDCVADTAPITWQFLIVQKTMIVYIPEDLQKEKGFKDGLVALLEHGEDDLGCSQAIAALENDRADRATLLRLFMFLGFSMLPPHSIPAMLQKASERFIFLEMNFCFEED